MQRLLDFVKQRNLSPIKVLTVGWLPSLIMLPVVGWMVWNMYNSYTVVATEEFKLQRLVGTILHLDEVETMYARLAASSGDLKWERLYRSVEPVLDDAITDVALLATRAYERTYAAQTKLAYARLIEMEGLAFALVRDGRADEARQLLFSDEYEKQKQLYSDSIERMTSSIQTRVKNNIGSVRRRILGVGFLGLSSVAVLFLAWLGVVLVVRVQLHERKRAEEALQESEARYRAVVEDQTELICRFRPDGNLTFVNEAYCRYFGKTRDDLLGANFFHFIPEEDRSIVRTQPTRVRNCRKSLVHVRASCSGSGWEHRMAGVEGPRRIRRGRPGYRISVRGQ